jgi:hypothetical protein
MHAVTAMLGGRVCRNGAVVGFAEDRACICGGGWHRAKHIGCRRLFSERFLTILWAVDGAVAAVGCAVGQAARWGWWSLAEDEELDEGAN